MPVRGDFHPSYRRGGEPAAAVAAELEGLRRKGPGPRIRAPTGHGPAESAMTGENNVCCSTARKSSSVVAAEEESVEALAFRQNHAGERRFPR